MTSAFGSHNVRSIAHAQALAEQLGIDRSRFEFQLLYGMAGPIKRALVEMGYRVREYCPVGELLPGMSYLVRRLLENTSNEGFLRAKFSDNVSAADLLRDPNELVRHNGAVRADANQPAIAHSSNGASSDTPPGDTYENAPLVNFVYKQSQDAMRAAIEDVRKPLGQKYPLVIDGEKIWTDQHDRFDQSEQSGPGRRLSVRTAEFRKRERAVAARKERSIRWSRMPVEERAQLLERVAAIMERRRYELSALEVFEVGKAWAEADGDIREAMDFCLFYAQPDAADRSAASDAARSRRRKLSALLAARCRSRHRAMEFSDRDS